MRKKESSFESTGEIGGCGQGWAGALRHSDMRLAHIGGQEAMQPLRRETLPGLAGRTGLNLTPFLARRNLTGLQLHGNLPVVQEL